MASLVDQLRRLFTRTRQDHDVADELRAHAQLLEDDFVAQGLSRDAARRRARLTLGNPPAIVENVRDGEWLAKLEGLLQDLVWGFRSLRHHPLFSFTTIVTLAIGIGANTLVFTILHALLLRSLPVSEPHRLARLALTLPTQPVPIPSIPYAMLRELRAHNTSFTDLSGWVLTSADVEDSQRIKHLQRMGLVTGNAIPLLGLQPHLGRLLGPSDDVPGGPASGWPAVVSYGVWQDRFGADPAVVGRTIRIADTPVTIVGIMPRDFSGPWPGSIPEYYLPLPFLDTIVNQPVLLTPRGSAFVGAIARLKPGITLSQAGAEITARQADLLRDTFPAYTRNPRFKGAQLKVESAHTGLPGLFGPAYTEPLTLMQVIAGAVLFLCCLNVSGLMLAKIEWRRQEFAIRTAIGAARTRLIRQYLAESFTLAALGAALGGVAAWYGVGYLLPFFRSPNAAVGLEIQPDLNVLWITSTLAVLTTLVAGLYPAWRAGAADPALALKSRTGFGRGRLAGRVLIPLQVALSLVLVTLAALLSQSLLKLRTENTGFDLDHVTIQTPPFSRLPQKGDAKLDLYQRMVDRIAAGDGVRAAAVTWYTPMTGAQAATQFVPAGDSAQTSRTLAYNHVGPGYFRTMAIRLSAGREFQIQERRHDLCILNESAAALMFPRQGALGAYVRTADEKNFPRPLTCQVIGIAESAKFASLREPPPPTVYYPINAETLLDAANFVFLINAQNKAKAIAAYQAALKEVAPSVPLVLFATLREQMEVALGSEHVLTLLCNLFAGLSLFLSAIGLYALLSTSVARRTPEMGVRLALGARPRAVIGLVLGDALALVAIGLALGLLGLAFSVGPVRKMLYGVTAFDPLTIAATLAVLLATAIIAVLPPALRAASVDPVRALRAD